MYVCVRVCEHVPALCACMCVWVVVCMHACMCVYVHVYVCTSE